MLDHFNNLICLNKADLLWSVDWKPVDETPAQNQMTGRKIQEVREDVTQVIRH